MYGKLTPETDSLVNTSYNKITWLKNTPDFKFTQFASLAGKDVVYITPERYVYNKEVEVLASSLQFKLNATRMLVYHADSLLQGLEAENELNRTMLHLKTKECIIFENENKTYANIVEKQENAIKNLERSRKIYRRRNTILGGVAIVAITSAIIISISK